jgi:hypothetical protein
MCFSQFAQYGPRPVKEYTTVRPAGAPLTQAEQDPNLFGAIPAPPEWRVEVTPEENHAHDHPHDQGQNNGHEHTPEENHAHDHPHDQGQNNGHEHITQSVETPAATVYAAANQGNGAANRVASVSTQTLEAVVVELANGTKLLICPL